MEALIGPLIFVTLIGGLFYHFWRNARKHELEEKARFEKQRQDEAAYRAKHPPVRSLPVKTSRRKVVTPPVAAPVRVAAVRQPRPVQQVRPSPAPTPAPQREVVVVREDDSSSSLASAIAGAAIGFGIAKLLEDDDRPSTSCTASVDNDPPIVSGGGGDFGGGGADSSWDDSSSSSSSSDE